MAEEIIKNYALASSSSWQLETWVLFKLSWRALKQKWMLKYQFCLTNYVSQNSGKYASVTVLPSSLWVPIPSHGFPCRMRHPLNFHPAANTQKLETWRLSIINQILYIAPYSGAWYSAYIILHTKNTASHWKVAVNIDETTACNVQLSTKEQSVTILSVDWAVSVIWAPSSIVCLGCNT